MTVSVIIPTYNYGEFLSEALASVLAQTMADWECLVVDDGSADSTQEIVAAIARDDPRVRYVRQAHAGPSAARNSGLLESTGEFVQFLDADDRLGPRKLEHHAAILAAHTDIDIVYGDAAYFRAGAANLVGDEWMWPRPSPSGDGASVLATLVDDNFMVIEAPLVRRRILDRVGGFNPAIRRMEDWECWLRCAIGGATFLHDASTDRDCLAFVGVHARSSSQDLTSMARSVVAVREHIHEQLPDGLRCGNTRRLGTALADLGMIEGFSGEVGIAVRHLVRAWVTTGQLKWLGWAVAMPLVCLPAGRQAIDAWRRRKEPQLGTPRPSRSAPRGGADPAGSAEPWDGP